MSSTHDTTLDDALLRWLPRQRWFAHRAPRSARVVWLRTLLTGDPALTQALVLVDGELYQVLLGHRARPPEPPADAWICDRDGVAVYDATRDPELMSRLPGLLGSRLVREPGVGAFGDLPARLITTEQSNTSVVYGERYILKLFRRPRPGTHPEVELHRTLASAGCEHVARLVGSVTEDLGDGPTTLALVHEFLPGAVDAWTLATADAAHGHASDAFVAMTRDLGRTVASVHADLAHAFGTATAPPDVDRMHRRLTDAVARVPGLASFEARVRAVFDRAGDRTTVVQRVHGDLHLGQVLRADDRWTLIDFEGEPSAPLADRNALRTPLQDVASMLRSFDYAAHHRGLDGPAERAWAAHAVAAFCDGYAEVRPDPRDEPALLSALELDKAVYEVVYEEAHRPEWTAIPLGAITRLLEGSDLP
ncbi:phosphotransferase [Actinosynnema sp. NPDC091369]